MIKNKKNLDWKIISTLFHVAVLSMWKKIEIYIIQYLPNLFIKYIVLFMWIKKQILINDFFKTTLYKNIFIKYHDQNSILYTKYIFKKYLKFTSYSTATLIITDGIKSSTIPKIKFLKNEKTIDNKHINYIKNNIINMFKGEKWAKIVI